MSETSEQANYITLPRASELFCTAVNSTPGSLDLSTVSLAAENGLVGHYAYFHADGADVYVVFGLDQASVTSGNAPVAATNGLNVPGVCFKIPSGSILQGKVRLAEQWVGYVSTGSGQLRIGKSSY